MRADRLGEDPHIIAQALDNDVEVPPEPLLNLTQFTFEAADPSFEAAHPSFEPVESSIDPPIEAPKAGIHRAFELQDGHGFARGTHLNIVVPCEDDAARRQLKTLSNSPTFTQRAADSATHIIKSIA